MLLDLSVKEFFDNETKLPQEFKIDLHSIRYESETFLFETEDYPEYVREAFQGHDRFKAVLDQCIQSMRRSRQQTDRSPVLIMS